MFSWFWQRKKFENRSIFDKVKAYKKCVGLPGFWATLYTYEARAVQYRPGLHTAATLSNTLGEDTWYVIELSIKSRRHVVGFLMFVFLYLMIFI